MTLPLEDYGLIGDLETAALVSRTGSIDWLCLPRFDSDACCAALLGDERHGFWRIGPAFEGWSNRRGYRDDTLILESEFARGGNAARLIDFMPPRDGAPRVIRIVEGRQGQVPLRLELSLRFDYGQITPWLEPHEDATCAIVGPDLAAIRSPIPLRSTGAVLHADFTVSAGQRLAFSLAWGPSNAGVPPEIEPGRALATTEAYWRNWAGRFAFPTRWRDPVLRSLITLKALIHRPTGGLTAAPTTSLPEVIGGSANWDYRFCWLRDATFTVGALLNAGYHDEAVAWRDWMLRAIAGSPDRLRIMYRVDGGRHVPEWELSWLPGYAGSRPARAGNAAAAQRQVDVRGELIEAMHLMDHAGLRRPMRSTALEQALVEQLETGWRQPGHGLWEDRGEPEHYVYSKVMAWVGIDRFLRGAPVEVDPEVRQRLAGVREQIHAEVCERGYSARRGHFVQRYGTEALDGSLLLLAPAGFLPADDPRIEGTIAAIRRELMVDGLVLRKPRSQAPHEGAFLPCTCWLADCLSMQGRDEEAAELLEQVLAVRNDLGLLSEQYDPERRRLCGNFPQALSHLSLVNTALGLSGPVLERAGG
jgi:GH15 family glucan-1,4-alpha-glucosidase